MPTLFPLRSTDRRTSPSERFMNLQRSFSFGGGACALAS